MSLNDCCCGEKISETVPGILKVRFVPTTIDKWLYVLHNDLKVIIMLYNICFCCRSFFLIIDEIIMFCLSFSYGL